MLKVIELFSGIGAQAKALSRLGTEYEIVNTCDWDVNAIIAYCKIHKGYVDTEKYMNVPLVDVNKFLKSVTISLDGKKPISESGYLRLTDTFKRTLYAAIKDTNNMVSITDVKGIDIIPDADIMTYSFPCQDLSLCGCWHGNKSGIARDANNRSGMLWEVERILKEMKSEGINLPRFLLMENVPNILSLRHKSDFDSWKGFLSSLGYENTVMKLDSRYFGTPQSRPRAYMISTLCKDDNEINIVNSYFEKNNLEIPDNVLRYRLREYTLSDALRLDYEIQSYKEEAMAAQPNNTESRQFIRKVSKVLFDGENVSSAPVNTVTTKQDRNPNSGLIMFNSGRQGKAEWRYLTPRECFLLMGFDEQDFERVIRDNFSYFSGHKLITLDKLYKMAGNSICVDVLSSIFAQLAELKGLMS